MIVACMALICSSCGISYNATSNSNISQTQVVLSQKNYKVIGTVKGESTQNYWFGIGGLSRKSMNQAAMSDMYQNAGLEGKSRAVINVSVCYKTKGIIIYTSAKALATGTVIEFID